MITSKGWYSFFASVVLLAGSAWAAPEFSYELTPTIIEPGQRSILELRLKRQEGRGSATLQDVLLTKHSSVKVLESDYDDSGEILIWRYQITSYQAGEYKVPPIELKYGPATYSTETKILTVISGRSPQDASIRPAFGAVALPVDWSKWFPWILAALALAIGIPLFRRFLYPRISAWVTNPSLGLFLQSPSESPQQWLGRQLRRIRNNMNQSRGQAYWLDDLTDVLREYFSRQYGRPTRSWTLEEMKAEMGTIPAIRDIVDQVLAQSDRLRFSGDPSQQDLETVRALLEQSEKALLKCGN